jgi:recombination protein RecA
VLDLALAQKLVVRSGAWFRFGDVHLGQGREKARQFLKENPAITEQLKSKIQQVGDLAAIAGTVSRRGGGDGEADSAF